MMFWGFFEAKPVEDDKGRDAEECVTAFVVGESYSLDERKMSCRCCTLVRACNHWSKRVFSLSEKRPL